MALRRTVFAVWLAVCVLFCLHMDSWAAPALLACSVVVAGGSAALGALSGARLTATLDMPSRVDKGGVLHGRVHIGNTSLVPVFGGELSLQCTNAVTGVQKSTTLPFSAMPRSTAQAEFELASPWCGRCELAVEGAVVYDVLGIVRRKRPLAATGACLVDSHPADLSVGALHIDAADMESFRYSPVLKGTDPSETFDLREYQPGDSVKRIHWKLTHKTGDVMVREASYPVYNSLLILVETGFPSGALPAPAALDACAEVATSIATHFAKSGIDFVLACPDAATQDLRMVRVDSEDALVAALELVLSARRMSGAAHAEAVFAGAYNDQPFSHVVLVTAGDASADTSVFEGSACTVLRCADHAGTAEGEVCFTAEGWREQLQGVAL